MHAGDALLARMLRACARERVGVRAKPITGVIAFLSNHGPSHAQQHTRRDTGHAETPESPTAPHNTRKGRQGGGGVLNHTRPPLSHERFRS